MCGDKYEGFKFNPTKAIRKMEKKIKTIDGLDKRVKKIEKWLGI